MDPAFYVSLSGDDANPGTVERPFVTLIRARDAIREAKSRDGASFRGATVHIRGGSYPVDETLELTGEDSGTESGPVV